MIRPALLIIDMQMGMTWARSGVRNNPGAETTIADLLAEWRKADAPRVHIRHASKTPGSPFWPGQPGADFQPALAPLDNEVVFEKSVPDAFCRSSLEAWLREHGIEQLVIVGVSTNNSVEGTARSAGNLGFETFVASDATFAFEKMDFDGRPRTAQEVHAMALANLQGEYATVIAAAEARALLAARRTE
jgi:nicotinamidase-related amidase